MLKVFVLFVMTQKSLFVSVFAPCSSPPSRQVELFVLYYKIVYILRNHLKLVKPSFNNQEWQNTFQWEGSKLWNKHVLDTDLFNITCCVIFNTIILLGVFLKLIGTFFWHKIKISPAFHNPVQVHRTHFCWMFGCGTTVLCLLSIIIHWCHCRPCNY